MQTAYVIFEDSQSWWVRPFKRNFRHVSVLIPLPCGLYLHVDPRRTRIDYKIIPQQVVTEMYDNTLYYDIVILKTVMLEHEGKGHLPSVFTCVETVKRTLGIYKWWILTPHQLYNYLRRTL